MMKKRLVLIDEDERFLEMVQYMLGLLDKVHVVNSYRECTDALKQLERDQPDIVMMDLDFTMLKGPEFIVRAKKINPRLDILVMTDHSDEDVILNVLSSGATGFLLKQNGINQIPEAIKAISRGGSPLDPMVARVLVSSQHGGWFSPLTPKETTVLRLMMNGMTYSMIAKELGIAKDTSKTHIKNIYKKLNVSSRAQAVSKAITDKLVPSNLMYQYLSFKFMLLSGVEEVDMILLSAVSFA